MTSYRTPIDANTGGLASRASAALLLAALLLPAGCATQSEPPPVTPMQARTDRMSATGTATTVAVAPQPLSPLDDPGSPLYRKVVFFDYDSAEIQPQFLPLVRTHAGYMSQQPGTRVTLEGHTDERGTRSYNLALGERRADTVKRFLIAEGVPPERLGTLSYGEERPADPGHGEQSWAVNRRVELVY